MAFGLSLEEVLLKIDGEPDDAIEAINKLATRLAVFSKQTAEAEANVQTTEAMVEIRNLRRELEVLDKIEVDPKVNADIAQALIELEIVEQQVRELDGREADIDIDVQRGVLERLNAVSNSALTLTKRFDQASESTGSWFSELLNFRVALGPIAGSLSSVAPILAVLIPLITSVAAAIVALAASLGAAVAGLGALGIAAGGVLLPAIGLVVAGIARFKDQSDVAGSAANDLKNAFSGISDAAKTLLPAVDPIFRAMATGLNAIKPLIGAIGPAFRQFGQDAAGAINVLVKQLASPAVVGGLTALISQAGAALAPLASIAGSVVRIFLNIANAAMPFLTQALAGLAGGIGDFADATGNIGNLRGIIAGLVSQLSSWLALLGSIAGVLLELGGIAAPFGQDLVDGLTQATEGIRNFLQSAEGSERVKQFFADVMPLVEALIPLIGQIALAFIQIGQALAPVLTPMIQGLTTVFQVINFLLNLLNMIPAPIRGAIGVLATLVIPIFALQRGIQAFGIALRLLPFLLAALGAAGSAALSVLTGAFNFAKGVITGFVGVVRGAVSGVPGVIRGAFGVVSGIVKAAFGLALGIIRGYISTYISVARTLGQGVVNGVRAGISAVVSAVRTAINAAVAAVRAAVGAALSAGRAVIQAVANALRSGASAVISAARSAITSAINAARSAASAAADIGRAIIQAMVDGVTSAASSLGEAAANAVKDALGKAKSLLPGSEPKDKSSPFVHLDRSGRAIVENIVSGINDAAPLLSQSMATLGGAAPAFSPLPSPVPSTTNVGGTANTFLIEAPGGEAPDAESLLAQIDLRLRARGGLG